MRRLLGLSIPLRRLRQDLVDRKRGLMKYQDALVAWTPRTDKIDVGPLISEDARDWSRPYSHTGGAAYVALRECKNEFQRDMMMFIEFHSIVVRDRVDIDAAHKAFLKIDEYRRRIAPDIKGADHDGDYMGGW